MEGHLLGLDSGDLLDGHVGESNELRWDAQLDREGSLDSGFVPAGKSAASLSGLELGDTHDLGIALGILVGGAVETGHLVVQDSLEQDVEDCGSLGQLLVECEGGGLAVFIKRGRRSLVATIAGSRNKQWGLFIRS